MRKIQPFAISAALVVVAAVLAGCGDGDDGATTPGTGVRTLEVAMLDDLRFEPASIEVGVGETVRFVLTNDGSIVHDFSLGDAMDHGGGMGDMGSGEGSETAVVLESGETGELTYTFDKAGEVEFGCHQPGHLEAGMVFTAHVS